MPIILDSKKFYEKLDELKKDISRLEDKINFVSAGNQESVRSNSNIAFESEYKKLKRVYDAFADEQSKRLFSARMHLSLNDDWRFFYDELIEINRDIKKDDFISLIKKNKMVQKNKFILYGTQHVAKMMYDVFAKYNIKFSAICKEDDGFLFGEGRYISENTAFGVPLISEDELVKNHQDAKVILGIQLDYYAYHSLIKKGCRAENLYLLHLNTGLEYFDEDIFTPGENEVFVDGGVLDLETSINFVKWCKGKYDAIYAFEPDPACYSKCLEILKSGKLDAKKCRIQNVGLWSEPATLSFESDGAISRIDNSGSVKIAVTSLDEALKNVNNVTFIKLDIEGAELEALKGAKNIIAKFRPRLAVCIYHKWEDFLDIPVYIQSLVPDYKFYIRHYSTSVAETVLYCV